MKITWNSLREIGQFQWCVILIAMFAVSPGNWANMGVLLIAPKLDAWCNDNSPAFQNLSETDQRKVMNTTKDGCYKPQVNFLLHTSDELLNIDKTSVNWTTCDQGVVYDHTIFDYTATEKYNLGCGNEWMISMANSIYMAGYFVGAITSGSLADRFGRKPVLIVSLVLGGCANLIGAFGPYVEVYFVGRFLAAISDIAAYGSAYIIALEMLRVEQRLLAHICTEFAYLLGVIVLGCLSIGVRNHVHLQIIISAMFFTNVFMNLYFMPESPRWLASRQQVKKSEKIIEHIAKFNNQDARTLQHLHHTDEDDHVKINTSPLDLLKTPVLRKRSLVLWVLWLSGVFLMYGLMFNLGDFGTDIRITLIISAVMDIPQLVIIVSTVDRFGRQISLFSFMLVAGLCCLCMWPFVEEKGSLWLLAFALVGKVFSNAVFFGLYQHTPELYPTSLRTQGLGTASTIGRIGGMIAPQVSLLNRFWSPSLVVILGAIALLSAFLVPILPDTTGYEMAQSIEEGEKFLSKHKYKLVLPPDFSCCGSGGDRNEANDAEMEEFNPDAL